MLEDKRLIATEETLSRRNFLVKAGALTAGMAVAGGLLGSVVGEADAAVTMPIPYQPLDIEKVRKLGFLGYKSGKGCCYGAAYGLLTTLQEQLNPNAAWAKFNAGMFTFGAGGVNGWGTLCGGLNGALYIMALAVGHVDTIWKTNDKGATMTKYGNELMTWYCKYPFPSATLTAGTADVGLHTGYAIPSGRQNSTPTVSGSPLCHVSVSTWCKATGFTVGSNEKSDRCAKLTGDCAAKAALILNAHLANRMRSVAMNTEATNLCVSCHAPGNASTGSAYKGKQAKATAYDAGSAYKDEEQGKMPCIECHTDEAAHTAMMDNTQSCSSCHDM